MKRKKLYMTGLMAFAVLIPVLSSVGCRSKKNVTEDYGKTEVTEDKGKDKEVQGQDTEEETAESNEKQNQLDVKENEVVGESSGVHFIKVTYRQVLEESR